MELNLTQKCKEKFAYTSFSAFFYQKNNTHYHTLSLFHSRSDTLLSFALHIANHFTIVLFFSILRCADRSRHLPAAPTTGPLCS